MDDGIKKFTAGGVAILGACLLFQELESNIHLETKIDHFHVHQEIYHQPYFNTSAVTMTTSGTTTTTTV